METLGESTDLGSKVGGKRILMEALSINNLGYLNLGGGIGLGRIRTQRLLDLMQGMSAGELSEVLAESENLPKNLGNPNVTYPLEPARKLIAGKIAEMLNDTTSIS